ncbi:MAG: thioredoxin-disulfide reductase [Bacteroidota bacterium]|nr:thioredoxin-disulfide reductase [Bacteroidota bacterium]
MEKLKCLIIGSGPAAYTAAIYAARANLNPVIIEGLQPGGQLTTTTDVENFPGYPEGVTGQQMMEDMKKQAQRFGTDVRFGLITEVDFSKRPFKIKGDPGIEFEAESVIISTGATAKYLGLESEEKFKGRGVSACATCDGFFYKGKDVAVVGGGDAAAEEATYLAGLAKKVYIIVRKDYMRASKIMQAKVAQTDNIEVLYQHTTKEILGDDSGVTGALLHNKKTNKNVEIKIDGFFLAIGHTPNSKPFRDYIHTDDNGYILTKPKSAHTNVEGVFACGDVQDPKYQQSVTAAGTGCMAALDAEKYLA